MYAIHSEAIKKFFLFAERHVNTEVSKPLWKYEALIGNLDFDKQNQSLRSVRNHINFK